VSTAFISYAHDGEGFDRKVLSLANRLRFGGVDVDMDAYVLHPEEGWTKWMEKKFTASDFLIAIINPTWISSFNQDDTNSSGARYEGAMLSALLSSNGVNFKKICIVCFDQYAQIDLPLILRGCPRYYIEREGYYDKLYAFLTSQSLVEKPPLGQIIPLRSSSFTGGLHKVESFSELCRALVPLVEDNSRIFLDFGPNSDREKPNEPDRTVRFDLSIWFNKRGTIVSNNEEIGRRISAGRTIIPDNYWPLFSKWLSHIDAFKLHVEDNHIEYASNRFPAEIIEIIEDNAK
jgi:SEFIR domain